MASDSSKALRIAVLARLKAESAVTDLVPAARIVSVARATKVQKPYIKVVGVSDARAMDTKTSVGLQGRFEIHAFAKTLANSTGSSSAEDILAAIIAALNDNTVAPDGHALVVFVLDYRTIFEDGDGETYHGVVRFRFMTCGGS